MTASAPPGPGEGSAPPLTVSATVTARVAETDLPSGHEKTAVVRSMFDTIAPRYDLVNRVMTFGLDTRWRRRSVRALGLPSRSLVLDLACGTGDFLTMGTTAGFRTVGMDLSLGMLLVNRSGRPLVQTDGTFLPVATGTIDGVTCGYALRNFAHLGLVFEELGRVVRPGGRISLLDVAEPENPLLLAGYQIWFRRMVPIIGGLLSDRPAYQYLPKSTAYLPDATELRAMLVDAGFSTVNHRLLTGGLSQLITATRRGRP